MATVWHYIKQIKTMIMNNTENEMETNDPEFELLDFTDEILLEIFSKFNDIDLLNAAQVCKRFKALAKEIFAKKYNGDSDEKYYAIKVYADDTKDDQKLYRTFLETFGNEISAINFISERAPNQHQILKLISQYCRSTKRITIYGSRHTFHLMQMIQSMSKLTNLTVKSVLCTNFYWTDVRFPHLTTFHMDDMNMDVQVLKQFLYINVQLEHLRITDCRKFPLKVIQALRDKMKKLKSLEYDSNDNIFGNSCRDINMEQLESLKITVDATSFRTVLEAIARGSKLIQHLDIIMRDDDSNLEGVHNQIDDVIPLFVKLTSLRLESFDLTVDVTRYLIRFLPNLVVLKLDGVKLFEFRPDDVLFIFKKCKHMKELLLESGTHSIETGEFNEEFHRQFREEIVQSRGCDIKFGLYQPEIKMTITAEKIIKNGELVYWTGYDVIKTHSKVHFLNLGDKCLGKIYSYLDEQSERALYETCTRTREAMQERITKQVFTVFDLSSAKDTFNRFGKHITKLAIDINTKSNEQAALTWSFIGTEFNEKITELSLTNIKVSAVHSLKIKLPNVTTLKIMSVVTSRTHIFPPIECPKLSHIEFHKGDIIFTTKATNFGLTLDHLTTIKLSNFNANIGKIIHLFDDKICDKLQEFSIYRTQDTQYSHMQLANIAMRFRNITTLNFCVTGIEMTNTKYLFALCTKLKKVSFGYDSYFELNDWCQTIQHIKDNCKHLEVFQLVRNYYGFDQDLLDEIADKLPNVKFNTVCYDENRKTYKVESYRKTTKTDCNTPF